MKLIDARTRKGEFNLLTTNRHLQAAMMTLKVGAASDDEPSNEHPSCEQWLFVISGTGKAKILPKKGRRRIVTLKAGMLLVIERGELHQIKNTGWRALRTVNFYVPPAYKSDGSVRPVAKRGIRSSR